MDISIFYASFGRDFAIDPSDCIIWAAALGFDAIEISVNDYLLSQGNQYIAKLRGLAADKGIAITCCGGGLTKDCDISGLNDVCRKAGIERLKRVLGVAKELGSDGLDGINYVPWNLFPRPLDRERRLDQCVKSVKELAKYCEDTGIDYAVEVANRYEVFLLNTAAEAVDFCCRVDSPRVKIQLDTYHMNIEEDDMCQAIRLAGDRLYSLHVSENNRKVPVGQGMMPWEDISGAVKDIGFAGHIELEPFLLSGGEIMYRSRIWKDNLPFPDHECVDRELYKGMNYIRNIFGIERKS